MPKRLLLPLLGAVLAAAAPAAAADRLAAVTLDGGRATVYSGSPNGLPSRHVFRGADRAVLSPDARLLAYTRRVGDIVHVRIASVASGSDRLVARVRPFDIALAFSPDGRRLAYSSASGIATVGVTGRDRRSVRIPAAWRGSRLTHLAYTPDARRLVVSRTTGDGRAGTLNNELVLVELGSGRATTLFRSRNAYDQQVRPISFTPNGAEVAIDGTGSIVLATTVAGEDRVLTPPPPNGYDHSPIVSPDGRWVAFARSPKRGVSDVWVIGTDNTGLRRVTTTPIPPRGTPKVGAQPLAWSPDATKLLVFRHDRVEVVDVARRTATVIRRTGVRYSISSARWFGPVPQTSRSGTILFSRMNADEVADLYTIRADGTGLRRLTRTGRNYDPAWSPAGDRIAFTSGTVFDRQLFTMAADGSDVVQLTPFGGRRWAFNPSWYAAGPTGLRLVFDYQEPRPGIEGGDLWTIGSDGGTMMPLTETPGEGERNGSFAPDGSLVFEISRRLHVLRDGVVTRFGEGADPKWSPDGRRLVSVRYAGLHGGLIVVSNADGTGAHSLGWGWTPSWSPDGTSIVFTGSDGLYVARADALGLPRRLTRTPSLSGDYWPSWTAVER